MPYSAHFLSIVSTIDTLMSGFLHHKKDIGYGYRWTFANKQRVDLIDYKKTGIVIMRFGRGAWLCRQYPMIAGIFDSIEKVIAKIVIKDVDILYERYMMGVFELLEKAPKGMKVFD